MQLRSYIKHRHFRHNTAGVSYTPKQLAAFYNFTAVGDGSGRSLGFVELGGGFAQKELDTYFHSLGVTSVKPVIVHLVDGAANTSDGVNGADGEVLLDLEVGGGMAPGAQLHVAFAPNTDAGYIAAVKALREALKPGDAISLSWGAAEDQWTASSRAALDAEFQACALAGITVLAAAGDNGSTDGEKGKHVDYPASSPYVIGCGGTSLPTVSPITETVWNDGTAGGATGGGVSTVYALPTWQAKSNVPGGKFRGVPDVAGVADPETGWIVLVDGQQMVIGGTSAVAPMWGALTVILSGALGAPLGFWTDKLYTLPAGCFRDITVGNNGTYIARDGYDDCTGSGVPNAAKIFAALKEALGQAPPPPAPPAPTPPPAPVPVPAHVTRTLVVTGDNVVVTADGKIV